MTCTVRPSLVRFTCNGTDLARVATLNATIHIDDPRTVMGIMAKKACRGR
jgi:hypothetical protein